MPFTNQETEFQSPAQEHKATEGRVLTTQLLRRLAGPSDFLPKMP